ncbi:MAG: phosphoglucomutase/phosphomannomutase family protein [Actinobacteria bacterium]|nr:phosphoglucomutase/phosphomannomutase family protein [Actinomycetota bacterium]
MEEKIKFGTDGWRAVIADEFTFQNVRVVALAISEYLSSNNLTNNGIFIGYDNRFLSEEFAKEVALTLADKNFKVYLSSGSVPTPVTAFMVRELNLDGAIMITASHNPPQYNGIKFIPSYGGPAVDEITQKIENNVNLVARNIERFDREKIKKLETKINYVSNFEKYKQKILRLIDTEIIKKAKPKVVVDPMYGAGSKILLDILNDLKIHVHPLNTSRDPLFGGKLPDPNENNLAEMKDKMAKDEFDLGVALDGDADRFGVIDGRRIFLTPNNVISLILYYLLKTRGHNSDDIVVRTVATTHLIDEICAKNNIKLVETPVGFKYIAQKMLTDKVIIGGEESGGLSIKNHIPEKDGILANLLLIEIQSFLNQNHEGMFLSDYLNQIYKEFGSFYNKRLDLEVPMEKKNDVLEHFYNQKDKDIKGRSITRISKENGIHISFDDKSWVLVRPSGTEPLIRCYIESRDREFFHVLKNLFS